MDGTAVLCTEYFPLFPGIDLLTSCSIPYCNQYEKKAVHHIVELPLGYFSQNASGRLRKVIDDNAGLTEGFLAHQLPDLTGAVVMPVAVIILIFVFDWRMGICCLIPMAVSVIFLKQMMGGDNADFMSKYMTALETMNKEAVEYIRGIPVVKVFQQTIYSFKISTMRLLSMRNLPPDMR